MRKNKKSVTATYVGSLNHMSKSKLTTFSSYKKLLSVKDNGVSEIFVIFLTNVS